MIIFPDFRRILGKKCKVYIKLTIIQGKNLKLKGEKLKTQAKNSRFRQNQKRGLPKIGRKKKADLNRPFTRFGAMMICINDNLKDKKKT